MSTKPPAPTPPTPYLTLDLKAVCDAYAAMRQAMPDIEVFYAVKCNPHPVLVRHIAKIGGSFEIASAPEMDLLIAEGIDPKDVLFTNPVKITSHIERTWNAGIWRYSFDSQGELEKLAKIAPGASVFVRLEAPHFESSVASEGKFGVDVPTASQLMQQAVRLGLKPYGISFHVGSQMESPQPWVAAITAAAELMRDLQTHDITIEMLDIGGGFPAFYGKTVPGIGKYGSFITKALHDSLPYTVKYAAEPGRYLVANAGVLTTTVIGVAKRKGKTWLHLDIGAFNGMMEALETQNTLRFPVTDSLDNATKVLYHLTGPSCDSQDSILFDVPLSAGLNAGDHLYIQTTGAYTTCYASTFNGFDIPKTILT